MKALPFKIPYTTKSSFVIQEDLLPHLYGSLHTHSEIQITLVLKSSGTLFLGDYIGDFREGDIYVIGSDVPHVFKNEDDYLKPNSGLIANVISLFIGVDFIHQHLSKIPEVSTLISFISKAKNGLRFRKSNIEITRNKFINICVQEDFQKLITLLEILNDLSCYDQYELLSQDYQSKKVSEGDGKRLNQIFEFTFKEYARQISLEEIADLANMTPQSFCRFFKLRTRKTYVNFLNEYRINKAAQLLREQDVSIVQISNLTGFNNLSHFNRLFRKLKNMTPRDYRSKARS